MRLVFTDVSAIAPVPLPRFGRQCKMRTGRLYASGPATVFMEEAVRHGVRCEGRALQNLSESLGVVLHPARMANVRLGNVELRVKPDAADQAETDRATMLVEVKCPYTDAARGAIRQRVYLHGRQILLELLAFPRAANLIFAVFAYDTTLDPTADTLEAYDSAVHRFDRCAADEAKHELERLGLPEVLALGFPNRTVDAILRRMVSTAVELCGVHAAAPATIAFAQSRASQTRRDVRADRID